MRESLSVYYAVGQPPSGTRDYLAMTVNSMRSLREFSPEVRVYCVLFGAFAPDEIAQLVALDAIVIQKEAVAENRLYVIKFLALQEIAESSVLFIDADTFFFGPVEKISQAHRQLSFYAKVESGCDRSGPNHDPRECNWPLIDTLADRLQLPGAKKLPLYNSGVMVFNHHFHKRLLANLELLIDLRDRFASDALPYPHFFNRHIVGEIATLFALGASPEGTFGTLAPGSCTFWHEHHLRPDRDWGVVCHTFANHYDAFLEKLPEALERRGVSISWA